MPNDENSNGFLTQVKGFTPVIDVLADEVGLVTAVVYGIVWRYCKRDGVCQASKETIAAHAHISDKTVQRHLQKLCDHGYLEDRSPDLRNRPHTYVDTGKAAIIGLAEARVAGEAAPRPEFGRTESPTKKARGRTESHTKTMGGRTESPGHQDRESHPGRTESPMKREREREGPIDSLFSSSDSFPAEPPFRDRLDALWKAALAELKLQTTKATFDTWLAQTRAVDCAGGTLIVAVPDHRARDWLENRLNGTVLRAVQGILGESPPDGLHVDAIQFEVAACAPNT